MRFYLVDSNDAKLINVFISISEIDFYFASSE